VEGHEIDDLQISIASPADGVINIPISITQIADFQIANITVIS
jgi:hypothetical protein